MKRMTALAFVTLIMISALVVAFSQPVSALSEDSSLVTRIVFQTGDAELNETEAQEINNMLIVALGGVIAVVLFLSLILFRVIRKRKRKL